MIQHIISGGQTGADQGGLEAAHKLGITTGGYAPADWMTEDGPRRELLEGFGLTAHRLYGYPGRTKDNVLQADATVIFGNASRGGSYFTFKVCKERHRPVYIISNPAKQTIEDLVGFRAWLFNNKVKTLNVAGNRESRNPGIGEAVRRFLVKALREEEAK